MVDEFDILKSCPQLIRQLTRILFLAGGMFDLFGKLEPGRECEVAELRFWRHLDNYLVELDTEFLESR